MWNLVTLVDRRKLYSMFFGKNWAGNGNFSTEISAFGYRWLPYTALAHEVTLCWPVRGQWMEGRLVEVHSDDGTGMQPKSVIFLSKTVSSL